MTAKAQPTSKELLREMYTAAKIKNGFLDVDSIKSVNIFDILKLEEYGEVADWSCIFHTIFDIYDIEARHKRETTKLDQPTIDMLANRADAYLKSLPLKYHLLLPLPKGLDVSSTIKVNKDISVEKINPSEFEKYEKANPDPNKGKTGLSDLAALLEGGVFGDISFKRPSEDDVYLKVKCTGYIANGNSTVYELDPMYSYKILFSLAYVLGDLKYDNVTNPYSDEFSKFAFKSFKDDYEFVTAIARPIDEAKLINRHKFECEEENFAILMKFYGKLISKQSDTENEKLRNQIINSLFWYFEVKKTDNPNMQTVLFTSVFDSFFEQTDKGFVKAKLIALESSDTASQQKLVNAEILDLYNSRNEIIHGERPLLEYQIHGKKSDEKERARVQVSMTTFYSKFLRSKLSRYAKSVGLI